MKYILTNTNNEQFGPFNSVSQIADGYLCDNVIYYTVTTGEVNLSEVADDYMTPGQIETYNVNQADLRAQAYPKDSDPIFFQYQRGIKTQQEWLDAVAVIQAKYPYKEYV